MTREKKILIVSSEPELLGLLQDNLSKDNYQVTSVGEIGDDLKGIVDEVLPDLIILDILMPWLDGIEVCLRLRQWCQAPVIMLSTWDTEKDTVRSLDLSSDGYLSEPYDVADLMAQIDNTLHCN